MVNKISDFLASLPTIEAPLYGGGTWTAPDIKKMVGRTPEGKAAKIIADAVKRRLGKAAPAAKIAGEILSWPVTEPVKTAYRAGQIAGSKNVPTYQKLPRMMMEALPLFASSMAGGAVAKAVPTRVIAGAIGKTAGLAPAKNVAARLIQQAAGALWRASTPSVSKIAPIVINAQAGAVGAGSYRALDQLKKEIEAKSKVGEAAKRILLAGGEGAVAGTVLGGVLGVPGAVSKYRNFVGQPGMRTYDALKQAKAVSPASLTDTQLKALQKSNIFYRDRYRQGPEITEAIKGVMKTRPVTQTVLDKIVAKAKKFPNEMSANELMKLREYRFADFNKLIPEKVRTDMLYGRLPGIQEITGKTNAGAFVKKLGIGEKELLKIFSHRNEGQTKGMMLGNRTERLIYSALPADVKPLFTKAIRENPGAPLGTHLNEAFNKAGMLGQEVAKKAGQEGFFVPYGEFGARQTEIETGKAGAYGVKNLNLPRATNRDMKLEGYGGGLRKKIQIKTDDIIKAIGKPDYLWKSKAGTDSKVAAEWNVKTPFGIARIYDYKTGPQYEYASYDGPRPSIKGLMSYLKKNTDWHIGARSDEAAIWLMDQLSNLGSMVGGPIGPMEY